MKYVSTRGRAPELDFEDALLAGLASDGGLYVPAEWPRFDEGKIADLAGLPYAEAAHRVIWPYVAGAMKEGDLASLLADAYRDFSHPAVAPLRQVAANDFILELFHGPTLAFKDIAMQALSRLVQHALSRRGEALTIIGATSGDTGAAAVEAFRGRDGIDVFMLFPHGRISDAQRRQMTTATEPNVHIIAVEGTFDDCQALLKALFADAGLRKRLNLSAVNSINWARLMAQIVYYFTSAVALGAPHRRISFAVPTGNFGDVFAGYAASRMGLPVERLVIATNLNDILARALVTGRYEPRTATATLSPSMDIQVSSNFERLVFELADRNAGRVRELMAEGSFALNQAEQASLRQLFSAARANESEVIATIRDMQLATGALADPHTAVGIAAARKVERDPAVPMVMLATAHAAKFPGAIERATGMPPPEPDLIARQRALDERLTVLPNDFSAVAAFISERASARRPA